MRCGAPVARWCTDCNPQCGRGYCVDHLVQVDLLGCQSVSADGLNPGPEGPERRGEEQEQPDGKTGEEGGQAGAEPSRQGEQGSRPGGEGLGQQGEGGQERDRGEAGN